MTLSSALPSSWVSANLSDLLREPLRNGHSAKASAQGRIRILTLTAVTSGQFSEANTKVAAVDPGKVEDLWLEPNDLLIQRSNTAELVGTARLFRGPCRWAIFPDLVIRARFVSDVSPRFVELYLQSSPARTYFRRKAQGIAGSMPKIDQGVAGSVCLPLPPRAEQSRIVEELERQLSRLDSAVSHLFESRRRVKSYRTSVLKAACDGRLVPTEAELARAEGREYEPADQLLARILKERRNRWEEDHLAKLTAKGKPPKDDTWKRKYLEPTAPDHSELPQLPEGWAWATVAQVSQRIQYGMSARTRKAGPGIPVLRMGNILDGRLELSELKYLPTDCAEFPELWLEAGDLLFNRTNSAELVGKGAVYEGTPAPCSFASYLIRVRLISGVSPHLLAFAINGPRGRTWIRSVVSQQVGQANVNGSKLAGFALPVPPLDEQHRIVAEVERRLSIADQAEAAIEAALARAERLRQAILKRAFEGRLVPQDPDDEPASVLLERIRARREAEAEARPARRSPRRSRKPRARKNRWV